MKSIYEKDTANKKLMVTREFAAPLKNVWQAWTDPQLLDQWWAPKPFKAETHKMDFRAGGNWFYAMKGPEGEVHKCRAGYNTIVPLQMFEGDDAFCDENWNDSDAPPPMHWKVQFHPTGANTIVKVEITYGSVEDMETIIQMGFQEGFSAAHENLDELLVKGS